MTEGMPERAVETFAAHDSFERDGETFVVTTTRFESRVTGAETDDWALEYTLTVRAPMLSAAVDGSVGDAVESGWFDTYSRRLEDATAATRADVTLDDLRVTEEAGEAVAAFVFKYGNASHAPDVVTAIAEYAEGTYVEGAIPGYAYEGVVADLLGEASTGEGTGTPL